MAASMAAIRQTQADPERPSLIICKTVIGYGSPEQDTAKVHGEPLGEQGVGAAKEALGWPQEPAFYAEKR
jgi:transketolase